MARYIGNYLILDNSEKEIRTLFVMNHSGNKLEDKYGFENPFKSDPLARKALRYLKKEKHLIDVGCGEGADTVFYAKKGFKVLAIDANKEYLGRLRKFIRDEGVPNISIRRGDVINYPFPQGIYGAINCLLVGCCMRRSEFEKLVMTLKQTIKRSGIIIMSLRNYLDTEFLDFVSSKRMIEPNTFKKKEACCQIRYFIEKNRLWESFSDFEILYYYEGYAPDKYKEVAEHGDSYIICRKR